MLQSTTRGLRKSYKVHAKYEAFYTGGRIQVSNDGEKLFCACGSKVEIFSTISGKVESSIEKDEGDVLTCFVVSCDDQILVTASRNGLLRQWNWQQKECNRTWKSLHTGPVACVVFDSTTTLLASGGSDSSIKVWDIVKQYCTHNLRGGQGVYSLVQFHPDISRLQIFGVADDNNIRVWDLKSSQVIACLENGHYSKVSSIQFAPDGNKMFSAGRDKVVIIWDIDRFTIFKTIPVYEAVEDIILLPQNKDIPSINVTEDETYFITAGDKGKLRVWQSSNGKNIFVQSPPVCCPPKANDDSDSNQLVIMQSSYNSKTNTITSVTFEHNIVTHDLDGLKLKKQFVGYNDEVLDIKFIGKNESHVLVATNSHYLKLFERTSFNCQLLTGHTDIILSVDVFNKNKFLFVSAAKDNTLRVWRMDSETFEVSCLAVGRGHTLAVGTVVCSKLKTDFIVSGSQDTTFKIWEVPDVSTSCCETTISSTVSEKAHEKDINSVAVSPNDKIVATASQDKTSKLWNSADGKLIGILRGHRRGIWCVEFSPVDQIVATSSADGTIKLWAISDFSCVKTFEGHSCSVLRIVFLSRGMQILSSATDGMMKLWNIKQNECIKTMDEHDGKIWALAVTSAEDYVMTGADDSNIILWKDFTDIDKEEELMKLDENVQMEQELSNLLNRKKFLKALKLAISLDQPYRVLNILNELIGENDGTCKLEETIKALRNDQLDSIFEYCVKWNTNGKTCHTSQFVLSVMLKSFTAEELLKLPNAKSHLEGLIPYTERHLQRMNRLLQQSMFIDYTWNCMKMTAATPQIETASLPDKLEANGMEQEVISEMDVKTIGSGKKSRKRSLNET